MHTLKQCVSNLVAVNGESVHNMCVTCLSSQTAYHISYIKTTLQKPPIIIIRRRIDDSTVWAGPPICVASTGNDVVSLLALRGWLRRRPAAVPRARERGGLHRYRALLQSSVLYFIVRHPTEKHWSLFVCLFLNRIVDFKWHPSLVRCVETASTIIS